MTRWQGGQADRQRGGDVEARWRIRQGDVSAGDGAVSGFLGGPKGGKWFQGGGLRTPREADAWRGYGGNTANPPDAKGRAISP